MKKYRIRYYEAKYGDGTNVLLKQIVQAFTGYLDAMDYAIKNAPNINNGIEVMEIE